MIEVKNLTKQYGAKKAVDNISFTIEKGEVVGLLGLNGAGKSTTMNILAGCLAQTEGIAVINGIQTDKEPLKVKRHIGYLPEIPPLYVDMKVKDYLKFVYELKGIKLKQKEHLSDISDRTGISDVVNRLIRNLSKGYRQRVGLAAALIGDPEILILDEPTVGLDPTQIIEIRNLISDMKKDHTVILSSHILSEIQAVCERVIVLNRGRIIADDNPKKLKNAMSSKDTCLALIEGDPKMVQDVLKKAQGIESVELLDYPEENAYQYRIKGYKGQDVRKALFFALADERLPLLSTQSASPTLEDVFLRLVSDEQYVNKGGEI